MPSWQSNPLVLMKTLGSSPDTSRKKLVQFLSASRALDSDRIDSENGFENEVRVEFLWFIYKLECITPKHTIACILSKQF